MFDRKHNCLVVVGAQWGDEGKGKLVDVLAERADVVVRYQGGANAGHTVVVGDRQFVLHQIPSGILHPQAICVVGNGVVLDPETFFAEFDDLEEQGIAMRRPPVRQRPSPRGPALSQAARPGQREAAADRDHRSRHRSRLRGKDRSPRCSGDRHHPGDRRSRPAGVADRTRQCPAHHAGCDHSRRPRRAS